jgi:hypothetical protein
MPACPFGFDPAGGTESTLRKLRSLIMRRKREARSQKPEARSQKPEARSQKPEARSQKPEARSQKPEARDYGCSEAPFGITMMCAAPKPRSATWSQTVRMQEVLDERRERTR